MQEVKCLVTTHHRHGSLVLLRYGCEHQFNMLRLVHSVNAEFSLVKEGSTTGLCGNSEMFFYPRKSETTPASLKIASSPEKLFSFGKPGVCCICSNSAVETVGAKEMAVTWGWLNPSFARVGPSSLLSFCLLTFSLSSRLVHLEWAVASCWLALSEFCDPVTEEVKPVPDLLCFHRHINSCCSNIFCLVIAPIIANKPASHAGNWGTVSIDSTGIGRGG